MMTTDPIADMLTRIRNANNAKHDTVDVPASNMKKAIAQILLDEGYIKSFQLIDDGTQGVIRITLKYNAGKEKVISGLKRVSKPGLRVYAGADELPKVLRGLGIAIVSTSKGVMTDKKAREAADIRNAGDQTLYNYEKTLGEVGDKIPAEDKSKVEAALERLREALKGADVNAIKDATEAVNKEFAEVGSKIYGQVGQAGPGPDMGGGFAGGQQSGPAGDGVVDADYEVIDDDQK